MARFGEIGKQYFDDAGDPLISGKLYFYESGTNTDKDTYADVNKSVLNSNPVILTAAGRQPNVFFDGSARVVLTKSDETQVEVRDPEGGTFSEGVFSPWNALTIYNTPDIVTGSNDLFYLSITDGNQANDPTTDTTNWMQIKFIEVFNTNRSYSIDDIAQASDGFLYKSLTNNNQGNDPAGDITNWGDATQAASVDPVIRASAKTFAYRNF